MRQKTLRKSPLTCITNQIGRVSHVGKLSRGIFLGQATENFKFQLGLTETRKLKRYAEIYSTRPFFVASGPQGVKVLATKRLINNHSDIQANVGIFPTDCALHVDFNTYAVSSSIIFDLNEVVFQI